MSGRVVERVATPEEHAALAASVGWESHFDEELRSASLRGSIAGVVYLDDADGAVGMARAVGDGLQYAYIQDVIVHPDHEGEGIATELVARLIDLLRPPPGTDIFIGLFASEEAHGVYESLGFSSTGAIGMHQRVASPGDAGGQPS
ncbi:GNAT family N-acetyltransferase [Leucobacter weissii]|uniref:GNAT family N-acetyltransferase n=1 Tax=Leucobacter weissii TaxID=1983706 RepID=A0A939S8C4_9MICO|nr:GNAT family N-acetyltransferase [Leucobacter weissii]MBO1901916.1 GNAT family N-acetyltransferase [Leucobacter weissii]